MKMNHSIETGVSFGLTSGIITTLGLMVGLDAGVHSKLAVLGGILTIAIADAFSDALGIHVSEESEKKSRKSVWESTAATFVSKLLFALTFAIPVIYLELSTAMAVSIAWGLLALGVLSYKIAVQRGDESPWGTIAEHLTIAVIVIATSHFVGDAIFKAYGA